MCWLRGTAHFPPCMPRQFVLATTARKQSTLRGDTTAVTSFFLSTFAKGAIFQTAFTGGRPGDLSS